MKHGNAMVKILFLAMLAMAYLAPAAVADEALLPMDDEIPPSLAVEVEIAEDGATAVASEETIPAPAPESRQR